MAAEKRDWKPVRRGAVYCSPACGGGLDRGCSWEKFQRVTTAARRLACQMGNGWKPDVWENLGWHFSVIAGTSCVRRDSAFNYRAEVNVGGQFFGTGKEPRTAFLAALKAADIAMEEWRQQRASIKELEVR